MLRRESKFRLSVVISISPINSAGARVTVWNVRAGFQVIGVVGHASRRAPGDVISRIPFLPATM
jgi:hypothetical protein